MYGRILTGLFSLPHVFCVTDLLFRKKSDCSPCLCYCITKQRQSSRRRDEGHAPSLRGIGFISGYPNPVLRVSAEIPEANKEVAANRNQSKNCILELAKKLKKQKVGFRGSFEVSFRFYLFFFSSQEVVATWGKKKKISVERKNHRNSSASVRTQWVEQKSVSKMYILYYSKSALEG